MDFRTLTTALYRVWEVTSPPGIHRTRILGAGLGECALCPGGCSHPYAALSGLVCRHFLQRAWCCTVGIVRGVKDANDTAEAQLVRKGACFRSLEHSASPSLSLSLYLGLLLCSPPPVSLSFCSFPPLSTSSLCPFPYLLLFLSFWLTLCLLNMCYLPGCPSISSNLSLHPCLLFPRYFPLNPLSLTLSLPPPTPCHLSHLSVSFSHLCLPPDLCLSVFPIPFAPSLVFCSTIGRARRD